MRSRRWDELSPAHKVLTMMLVSIQISLAVSAWADLVQRPRAQINGSKRAWGAIIAINVVGPVLYFRRGRRTVR